MDAIPFLNTIGKTPALKSCIFTFLAVNIYHDALVDLHTPNGLTLSMYIFGFLPICPDPDSNQLMYWDEVDQMCGIATEEPVAPRVMLLVMAVLLFDMVSNAL